MSEQLLVIIAPPLLEETLADWLLQEDRLVGFSSMPIRFHGTGHSHYSTAEQVSGRQAKVMYQIQAPEPILDELVAQLHARFHGAEIRYWRTPLIGYGKLG